MAGLIIGLKNPAGDNFKKSRRPLGMSLFFTLNKRKKKHMGKSNVVREIEIIAPRIYNQKM